MKKYKYILFDLDGTLTDPGMGITNSVMYALNKLGIEETDRTKLYKFIGPPLTYSFEEYYGFDEKKSWQAVSYYREYFSVKGLFENSVYEGIPQILSKLREAGHILAVATSKPAVYSKRILDKFELSQYFEYLSGSDLNDKNIQKANIIAHALEVLNAAPEDVLMIGDRFHDVEGAKANNVDCASVLYGYGDRKEHEEAGTDYILETVQDILQFM